MTEVKDLRDRAHKMVNSLFNEVDELKAKADKFSGQQREKFNKRTDELAKKRAEMKEKYEKFSESANAAKDDAWKGFEAAKQELDKSLQKIKADFNM